MGEGGSSEAFGAAGDEDGREMGVGACQVSELGDERSADAAGAWEALEEVEGLAVVKEKGTE